MKRALTHSLGFILAGLFIAAVLFWVSNHFATVYVVDNFRMEKMLLKANSIEAIDLGHSQNRAIDYRAMGMNGYHLWRPGSDIFEMHYALQAVVPLLPNLQVVFITVNPMAFIHDNSLHENMKGVRRRYYATMPTLRSWRLINGDIKLFVQGKLSPLVRHDHWKGVIDSIGTRLGCAIEEPNGQRKSLDQWVNDYGFIGRRFKRSIKPDSVTGRIEFYRTQIRAAQESYRSDPKLPEKVYRTLVAITKMLKEKNIRPIFFTPPNTDVCNEMLSKEASETIQLAKQYLQQLQESHGAEYYDFSYDASFTRAYRYFFNEDHLNKRGARIFSRKLRKICRLDTLVAKHASKLPKTLREGH